MKVFMIGGDLRMVHVAELLQEEGVSVSSFGMPPHLPAASSLASGIMDADIILMGLPVSRDGETIFAPFYDGRIPYTDLQILKTHPVPVFCGMPDAKLSAQFLEADIPFEDYFAREELAIFNAIPTAEGAIEIAMRELPITIHGARCLITGYGRIGKYLANALKALGASVTVAVRRESDFAWLEALGFRSVHIHSVNEVAHEVDLLINTVPHTVIDETVLCRMQENACIIDLASSPGGIDKEAEKKYRLKVIRALSLPSKAAPKTAGVYIYKTIKNILKKQEIK